MLICKDCGERIEASDLRRIVLNRIDGFTEYGIEDTCRECGSQELVEADWCQICGEWFPADQLTDRICPECYKEDEHELELAV